MAKGNQDYFVAEHNKTAYTRLRYGVIDVTMVINGVLAGLDGITAGCNVVGPWSAMLIGFVAGVLVDMSVVFIDNRGIDDPVGAIAVHGINGVGGTLAVGLFAMEGGLFLGGGAGISDENLYKCIDIILDNASTGNTIDGKIFVYLVKDAVRISARVRGPEAIR